MNGGRGSDALLAVALIMLLPAPAAAFTALNGMTAVRTGPTEITVIHDVRRDDTDYWCAAGDFARRELQLPGDTRLYRASPKPRKPGEGIAFTIDPAKAAPDAGLSHFGKGPRDGSISVGMAAANLCRGIIPFMD